MKFITKALLGIGLLAGLTSTAALAADYTPEPVVTASSFYLRGDLGWSWLDTENNSDSVFLMGPLYHLLAEDARRRAVEPPAAGAAPLRKNVMPAANTKTAAAAAAAINPERHSQPFLGAIS